MFAGFPSLLADVNPVMPWVYYAAVAAGAAGLFLLLPRAGRSPLALEAARMGRLMAAAGLGGLLVWLVSLTRMGVPNHPDQEWMFFLFAAIALVAAARTVLHPQPIYCALYLVLTVLAVSGLLVLAGAAFVATVLLVVYAGAILVVYVFVIMLARQAGASERGADADVRVRQPGLSMVLAFVLSAGLGWLWGNPAHRPEPPAISMETLATDYRVDGGTQAMGIELFRGHLLAIELTGVLLLVAIVGAIAVARRRGTNAGGSPESPAGGEEAQHV